MKKMNRCGEKTPRASQHDMGWKAQQTFSLLPVAGEIFLPRNFRFLSERGLDDLVSQLGGFPLEVLDL